MTQRLHPDDLRLLAELVGQAVAKAVKSAPQVCGFCKLDRSQVAHLFGSDAGPFICDDCIAVAADMANVRKPTPHPPSPVTLGGLEDQRFVRSRDVERHGGLVYAVATVPDIDIRRLKVGFTTRPIENRLDAFRTTNPTVALLGLWPAPYDAEDVAHRLLDGRLRNTEVFHVPDVVAALTAIDVELSKRWP